jgi:5-methylcytosine-specific restriction endonuclease McrA
VSIWKESRDEINRRIKKFKKSQEYKLIDNKEQEIEDIIQTVVQGINVDPRRLFTQEQKDELVQQYLADSDRHDGNKIRCEDCKQFFFEDELTVDHVKPWSKGGRTELSNAQLLCRPCNSKQGNRK